MFMFNDEYNEFCNRYKSRTECVDSDTFDYALNTLFWYIGNEIGLETSDGKLCIEALETICARIAQCVHKGDLNE